MPIKRRTSLKKGGLDLTPLIDVVFLLLIFFMLSSSFVLQPGIKVDLPSAVSSKMLQKPDHLLVTITANGNVYVNDTIVSIDNLIGVLSDSGKSTVLIQADGLVDMQRVVAVWDSCRRAGIQTLNIATTQKKL